MGTLQLVDCITVSFLFGLHNIFVCYEGYCVRQLYSRKFLPCLGQEAWHTTCWFIVHNVTWKELLRANFHSQQCEQTKVWYWSYVQKTLKKKERLTLYHMFAFSINKTIPLFILLPCLQMCTEKLSFCRDAICREAWRDAALVVHNDTTWDKTIIMPDTHCCSQPDPMPYVC